MKKVYQQTREDVEDEWEGRLCVRERERRWRLAEEKTEEVFGF